MIIFRNLAIIKLIKLENMTVQIQIQIPEKPRRRLNNHTLQKEQNQYDYIRHYLLGLFNNLSQCRIRKFYRKKFFYDEKAQRQTLNPKPFEIYINNRLFFSRLKTGKDPDIPQICQKLKQILKTKIFRKFEDSVSQSHQNANLPSYQPQKQKKNLQNRRIWKSMNVRITKSLSIKKYQDQQVEKYKQTKIIGKKLKKNLRQKVIQEDNLLKLNQLPNKEQKSFLKRRHNRFKDMVNTFNFQSINDYEYNFNEELLSQEIKRKQCKKKGFIKRNINTSNFNQNQRGRSSSKESNKSSKRNDNSESNQNATLQLLEKSILLISHQSSRKNSGQQQRKQKDPNIQYSFIKDSLRQFQDTLSGFKQKFDDRMQINEKKSKIIEQFDLSVKEKESILKKMKQAPKFTISISRSICAIARFNKNYEYKNHGVTKVKGNRKWHTIISEQNLPQKGNFYIVCNAVYSKNYQIEAGIMPHDSQISENKICNQAIGLLVSKSKIHDTNGRKDLKNSSWRQIEKLDLFSNQFTLKIFVETEKRQVYWIFNNKIAATSVINNYLSNRQTVFYISLFETHDVVTLNQEEDHFYFEQFQENNESKVVK